MHMTVSTGYDLRLVALSVLIAIIASYTALDLAGRVTVARGRLRALWLSGGAMAMGVGIWSMHFIGMLAFHASMPTTYNVSTVIFSLFPAILVSGLALFTVSHDVMTRKAWASGGIFMGLGIGAMHYSGMAAMRVGTSIAYDPVLFAASIGIAVGASLVALWLAFRLRSESQYRWRWTMASAVLMGFAIAGMHYTGMAAARFKPMSMSRSMTYVHDGTGTGSLAVGIGIGAFVILSFALLSSRVDKRFTAQAAEADTLRESEERLREMSEQLHRQLEYTRAITDSLGEGVCVLDANGAVTSTNPAAERLFGRREIDLLGRDLHAMVHPSHGGRSPVSPVDCLLHDSALIAGTIHVDEDTFVRQDGTTLVIAYSLSPVELDGERVGSVLAFHDMTEWNRAQEALRVSEQNFRLLFASNPHPVWVYDSETQRILEVNEAAVRHYGYDRDEFLALRIADLASPDVIPSTLPGDGKPAPAALSDSDARRHRLKDGRIIDVEITAHTLPLNGRESILVLAQDVTERKVLETQLRHQALHDALTDLPNRTLLRDRLQSEMCSADQAGDPFALLFMDLDRFKDVNDTLGHHAGDQLLKEVARRLGRTMRKTDLVARLGGDEFAIVLPATDLDTARHITEKIQKTLRGPLILDGHRVDLGASMGLAFYPVHGESVSALMRHADVAMYKAKRSGRAYDVYTAEHDANDPIRLSLVADLRHAIDHDELHLEYQPKVNMRNGSVEQVEALVRWDHPEQGLIPPSAFVPLAEETGLIAPLTLWVLRTALKQSAAWQKAGREIGMAVNLSTHNLQDPKLVETVAWMLRSTGVSPSILMLEITESSLMVDPDGARVVLQKLHAMGVKISIDDFGTGYSSLTYLKQLPVHEIKIDRSFVLDMGRDGTVIMRAVIDLGRSLGLEVTAEGVETQETWDELARMGCGMAQGYHISRPLPPAEVLPWLSEYERQTSMQSRQENLVFMVDR
jgi:diguanylate cyclase (GGDEF)-like protein/PAS domain S-box-containing protein